MDLLHTLRSIRGFVTGAAVVIAVDAIRASKTITMFAAVLAGVVIVGVAIHMKMIELKADEAIESVNDFADRLGPGPRIDI